VSAIVPDCTTRDDVSTGVVRRSVQAGGGMTGVVRLATGHQAETVAWNHPDDGPDLSPETSARHGQENGWYRRPRRTKAHVMAIAIYAALLPVCSFILGVFGFFVGRCARRIPSLDDNLPRVLHRANCRQGIHRSHETRKRR
jgi:hypothetical protein